MKKGLVLEGGAMRGLFSAGVLDVLMERGIAFDGIIGVSAGAAFGCNYKSGQIGRVLRYNTRFCGDKRYSGRGSLLKTGNLFNTEFCYNQVPLELDPFDFEAFRSNPAEFYVVCTDVNTGEPVYHAYTGFEDHGFEWIRASASLPLIAQIVEIDGQKLLDGGIADSIPFGYFESIGYDRNVVVLTGRRRIGWCLCSGRKTGSIPPWFRPWKIGMRGTTGNWRSLPQRRNGGWCLFCVRTVPCRCVKPRRVPKSCGRLMIWAEKRRSRPLKD